MDSEDAGMLASRFSIEILKLSEMQNKALSENIGGGGVMSII